MGALQDHWHQHDVSMLGNAGGRTQIKGDHLNKSKSVLYYSHDNLERGIGVIPFYRIGNWELNVCPKMAPPISGAAGNQALVAWQCDLNHQK